MRTAIVALLLLALTGCAGYQSPFGGQAELQADGATASSDVHTTFWTKYATAKYLGAAKPGKEAERRGAFVSGIADALETATGNSEATGGLIADALKQFAADHSSDPADQDLADYLAAQITPPDIGLPLSAEQRRVIGVVIGALRQAVLAWQSSQ